MEWNNNSPMRRRELKTTYTQRINDKINKTINKKWWNIFYKILIIWIISFVLILVLWSIFLYTKYIVWLPAISELENLEIAETSTIFDRDWNELYKIFKEKRTYVPFENINKNMINAIVAIEDKRYWTNPWVDILWLFRAWFNYILWSADEVKWTSTLTQQLIRNTIIKNEKSIDRKVKEIYLAYKLTSSVSKEKILELYLNKISYWHNAFGIEEAAKTFFGKSSKDIWILESSILASLPKWPTYYSPYNHPDRLVGFPYIYPSENEEDQIKIITKDDTQVHAEILSKLTSFIKNLKASKLEWTDKILICNVKKEYFKSSISVDSDWCTIIDYPGLIDFLNNVKIENGKYYIEYETWRKDRVLWRMLEDDYINFDEYKESIINWIWMTFSQAEENIKSPHFVFYVKEYLEQKFWQEIVSIGWLKIYTTLDWKLQEKAEELISKNSEVNATKYGATNAALISIDNKTWEILSMVWWKDYFDKENKWNVNIITSPLQPWSSFKPFVYSLAMANDKIWTKSPIYDLKTNFPSWYTPKNFDWKFMWKINISTALNNSRNIPAIKMFFMAWWESKIIELMKKLWVNSLKTNWNYWAPLALWTWEMTPLELATAYSVFANLWVKKEISPILKIVDSKWNIIEEKTQKAKDKQVIPAEQAYLINSILSDTWARPSSWNWFISMKNRVVAAKTWTSTKQYLVNNETGIFPCNLWTAWYTPQITTVVWAWNTNWKEVKMSWDWLNVAWPIWRDFMEFAHKWKVAETWKRPAWVKSINISEISWLLPNPELDPAFIINSLFINAPDKYDNSYKSVDVDALCNWKITEKTPEDAIKKVTLLEINSMRPDNASWQNPVIEWSKSDSFIQRYWNIPNLVTSISDVACDRSWTSSDTTIKTTINDWDTFAAWENFIEISYKSVNAITKISIFIWDTLIDEVKIDNKKEWTYAWTIFIPVSKAGIKTTIKFKALDDQYYSSTTEKEILIIKKDITSPEITLINPADWSIKLYNTDFFNLKATVLDRNALKSINIKLDWNIIKSWLTDRNIVYSINENKDIEVWSHVITIEVIDSNWNKTNKDINLEVLPK